MNHKIGVGMITCNSELKLLQTAKLIPEVDAFVIVNDGFPYSPSSYPSHAEIIQHDKNYAVAKSKNDALRYLIDQGCTHLFLIEDDVIIKSNQVFEKYINAAQISGIKHFNYALQGPNNRKQRRELMFEEKNFWEKALNFLAGKKLLLSAPKNLIAADRVYLSETSAPDPRFIFKYSNDIALAFYKNCVGAFSYYHKEVIEKVGYMDEHFVNAWEHVHHTYKIIQSGFHPPFWWFADISNVELYLDNIDECMKQSTIAQSPNWGKNVIEGEAYFQNIEGLRPGEIKDLGIEQLKKSLHKFKKTNNLI